MPQRGPNTKMNWPTDRRSQYNLNLSNIWSQVPVWTIHQDIYKVSQTDRQSQLTLTLGWTNLFMGDMGEGTWPSRLGESHMRQ
jgi:hypothetical protein